MFRSKYNRQPHYEFLGCSILGKISYPDNPLRTPKGTCDHKPSAPCISSIDGQIKRVSPERIAKFFACSRMTHTLTISHGCRVQGAPQTSSHFPWCSHSQSHISTQDAHCKRESRTQLYFQQRQKPIKSRTYHIATRLGTLRMATPNDTCHATRRTWARMAYNFTNMAAKK